MPFPYLMYWFWVSKISLHVLHRTESSPTLRLVRDPYIYATHVTWLLCRSSAVWPAGELVGYECYIAPVGLLVHKLLTSQTPLTVGFFLIRTVYEILLHFVFVVWCPQSFWSRLEFVIMVAWKPNNLCNTCFVKFRRDRARCIRGRAIIVLEVHADVLTYMANSLLSVFPIFLGTFILYFISVFIWFYWSVTFS